jgi:ABC-type multidrug transport system fused ATPase/permease subunit
MYPNSGETTPQNIVKYEITLFALLMIGISFFGFIAQSIGRMNFGIVSYNVTYDIRKKLYETILKKNIGYFDYQENSTPVLSGIMQNDTTIINGVATDSVPPLVEAATLLLLSFSIAFYMCW